jgi:hypothetical protein
MFWAGGPIGSIDFFASMRLKILYNREERKEREEKSAFYFIATIRFRIHPARASRVVFPFATRIVTS